MLGNEQHVYNLMSRVATGEGNPIAGNRMNSVVEPGRLRGRPDRLLRPVGGRLQADPFAPSQGTTLILGDGNAANGDACAWTVGGCAGDQITIGMPITLELEPADGTGTCTTGAQVTCNVPVNPRSAATCDSTAATASLPAAAAAR